MKLKIAGGCGEHGRNCFYVEMANTVFLVDCGVMAGEDGGGYPRLMKEEIRKLTFIFLTHSHADHTGALPWLIENGFDGTVIASEETLEQLPFVLKNKLSLESFCKDRRGELDTLSLQYGRSGHCMGSVWYRFAENGKTIFFSGDYVENNFVHEIDFIRGQTADIAVLDCAYGYDAESFEYYCDSILKQTKELKNVYPALLFPVPKYGRGLELYWMLKQQFPDWKFGGDEHFIKMTAQSGKNNWIKENIMLSQELVFVSGENDRDREADIIFVSDPQLRSQKSENIAKKILEYGYGIMTGTVEKGTVSEQLIKEKKMRLLRYPVHLNYSQFKALVSNNYFEKVIAYHSKEIDCEKEIVIE